MVKFITKAKSRRPRRRQAVTVLIAALTMLPLAACSVSGTSSGSSQPGQTSSKQVVSSTDLAKFEAGLEAAQKMVGYTPPGEPIPNPGSLRGDKIMVIPVTSQIPVCEQFGTTLQTLAPEMGMSAKTWDNSGQPSQWESGIQAAIQGHYKAIIFTCGVNPDSVKPQLEEAEKAGIVVVSSDGGDTTTKSVSPLFYGITTSAQIHYQQMNVEAAFVKSQGKAHDALIVTSNENDQAPPIVKAILEKYNELCGSACNVKQINVPIPDWSTQIQSSVQAALVANPGITAVYCVFADQAPYALPAIEAAHRSNVSVYTYGGDTGPLKAEQSSSTIAANWAASPAWSDYEVYYQAFRGMTGLPPLPPAKANAPYRDFTPENVGAYFTGSGGYGTEYVNGFRHLFGLPPLSGHALVQAALAGR